MKKIIFALLLISIIIFGCKIEPEIKVDTLVAVENTGGDISRGNTPCEICRAVQVSRVVYDVYNKPHTIMVWIVVCTKTYNCP